MSYQSRGILFYGMVTGDPFDEDQAEAWSTLAGFPVVRQDAGNHDDGNFVLCPKAAYTETEWQHGHGIVPAWVRSDAESFEMWREGLERIRAIRPDFSEPALRFGFYRG